MLPHGVINVDDYMHSRSLRQVETLHRTALHAQPQPTPGRETLCRTALHAQPQPPTPVRDPEPHSITCTAAASYAR